MHFGDRLCEAVKSKNTPLIVGLDPVYNRLPAAIREHRDMNDENDLDASVDAIFSFSTKVLRTVAPLVAAVKINIAYFEKYLWEGLEAYYSLITEADELGLEVIGDVKRGDIGHTAECYALGHLKNPEFAELEDILTPDAITINGFAGADGILPFAELADKQGKGVFVWVRASNPSAAALQDFADASGTKMYEKLAQIVAQIAGDSGRIGAVGLQQYRHGHRRNQPGSDDGPSPEISEYVDPGSGVRFAGRHGRRLRAVLQTRRDRRADQRLALDPVRL